jgi:hypothetical protein
VNETQLNALRELKEQVETAVIQKISEQANDAKSTVENLHFTVHAIVSKSPLVQTQLDKLSVAGRLILYGTLALSIAHSILMNKRPDEENWVGLVKGTEKFNEDVKTLDLDKLFE